MATQKILFRKNPLKMFACCCRCQCWNVRRSPTWNGFILAYDDFIFKRTKVVSQHECMGWRAFNIARVCVSRIFDVWCRFVPSSPPTFWTFFRSMLMAIWTLELSIQFFLANLIKIHPKMCSIQRFFYSIFSMIVFSWTFEPKEWWVSEIGSTKKLFNSFNWTDVVEIIDYVVWWTLSKPLLLCVISNVALFFTTKIPLWKILKKKIASNEFSHKFPFFREKSHF